MGNNGWYLILFWLIFKQLYASGKEESTYKKKKKAIL